MGTVWTVLAIEMIVAFVAAVVATKWTYRRLGSSRRRSAVSEQVRPADAAANRESRDLEHV